MIRPEGADVVRHDDATPADSRRDEIEHGKHRGGEAVAEHEINGSVEAAKGFPRIPLADLDEIEQTGFAQMLARSSGLARDHLRPDHFASAVLAHREGEVDRRDAERGTELDDSSGAECPCEQVAEHALAAIEADELVVEPMAEALPGDPPPGDEARNLIDEAPDEAERLAVGLAMQSGEDLAHFSVRKRLEGRFVLRHRDRPPITSTV
ncbi:hypothetical protein MYXO_00470 [Myxococcaceae bacterium]|nr:hypothetical protein MYXO_00470 [Myxococcaceae bacterium]